MNLFEYLILVNINDVMDVSDDISSFVCEKYNVKNIEVRGAGQGDPADESGRIDLFVDFENFLDLSSVSFSKFARDFRREIYKVAGRYVEMSMQGYRISGGKCYHGYESEYEEMLREGAFDIEIEPVGCDDEIFKLSGGFGIEEV